MNGDPDAYVSPDAFVAEACDRPGATELRACGNCGQASFRCESGIWAIQTPCIGEGVCRSGSFEMETNLMCGQRTRLCSATCTWGAWADTRPDGECVAGTRRLGDATCPSPTDAEFETCDAMCRWNTTGGCEDADGCRGTPRRTPAWSEEVCVRAGTFIRDPMMVEYPTAEIEMSAFFIDRYTVTYGRYLECYRAGACPLGHLDLATLTSPEFANQELVVGAGSSATIFGDPFCRWDGGRFLPTAAQWEYSARGPAPRRNLAPWDGDRRPDASAVCAFVGLPGVGCDARIFDQLAGTRSYFGVERQVGGSGEHMRDWYAPPSWFAGPESRTRDPYQSVRPFEGAERMYRGGGDPTQENPLNPTIQREASAFRCARPDTL